MKPTKAPKAIIKHFKGVSDYDPPGDPMAYSRKTLGVYDGIGGNLLRIPGKVSATSGPLGSIWSIAQLRFSHNWNILVHNSTQRIHYETPRPDPDGPVPDPNASGTPPPIPMDGIIPDPTPCHSYWEKAWGRWREADIGDITLYFSSRGMYGVWLAAQGGNGSCLLAVTRALQTVRDHTPPGWGTWATDCPTAHNPETASQVTLNAWNYCAVPPPPCARCLYQELRWTIKSATLAATDAYTYTGAIIRIGTMTLHLRGGLGSAIGNAWWGQTPVMVGGLDTNRSDDMMYYDVDRGQICSSVSGYSCPGIPGYTERFTLSTGACATDEAYFYNEGYRFFEHDSCYE